MWEGVRWLLRNSVPVFLFVMEVWDIWSMVHNKASFGGKEKGRKKKKKLNLRLFHTSLFFNLSHYFASCRKKRLGEWYNVRGQFSIFYFIFFSQWWKHLQVLSFVLTCGSGEESIGYFCFGIFEPPKTYYLILVLLEHFFAF